MSLLRRIEKTLDQRLRSIFSGGGTPADRTEPDTREAIELYRDALEQIAARATTGKRGDRVFPFNLVTIELRAEDPERKAILEALFDPGQLGDDLRSTLKEERTMPPADLTVAVRYPDNAHVEMRILCERLERNAPSAATPANQAAGTAITPARLITVTGGSSPPEMTLDRMRINLGREDDVVDSLGRTIRRNELVFPERAHEANGSVSRSHAHLRYYAASGEWRIFDDGSSLGTSLFRNGHRIDVPAHSSRGVVLRAGDEIFLGQVRVRFEMDPVR